MKNYRPLLLQEIDVRLPGLRVRRLRMNRHLPEVDQLAEHSHSFTQILCYLSGKGIITANGRTYETGPGSVAFLPPHCLHSFRETSGRRPLCLVLDLDWRGAVKHGFFLNRLSQSQAGDIKRELAALAKVSDPGHASCRLLAAAGILRILDTQLRATGGLPAHQRETPAFVRKFERLLNQGETPLPEIAGLARSMGYQTDYLNRIFKQATGQTLREYRDALLLKKTIRLLREKSQIKDVCAQLGFLDQNYFSRWFKKQTGLQPSVYANAKPLPPRFVSAPDSGRGL
ncbi:MAG: AraC family transcriptional regulator [Verrucomicrobia bacterium]|nr:AraC family transcriptional regulator [Verrucomicrobiota bacterium]